MNHLHEEALAAKWSQTTDIAILERQRVRCLEQCAEWVKKLETNRSDLSYRFCIDRAIFIAHHADAIAKEIDSYRPKNLPVPVLADLGASCDGNQHGQTHTREARESTIGPGLSTRTLAAGNSLSSDPQLVIASAELDTTPATAGDVISEPEHKQSCGSTGQVAGESLNRICSWCGVSMGGDPNGKITHGICIPCRDKQIASVWAPALAGWPSPDNRL